MNHSEYLDSPIFWLRRAYLGVRKDLDIKFGNHQVTSAQFEVLRQLWREDGQEQRKLQPLLSVRSATLSRIIDGLVEKGLVERRSHGGDGRVKRLYLTEAAQAEREELARITAEVQARLLRGFSDAEAALLKEWLKRMAENMGDVLEK